MRAGAGLRAYRAGVAAEAVAERLYAAEGARLLSSRWRCAEGEIDLILDLPDTVAFVEVKAARTLDAAAAVLSPRQRSRIGAAASRWIAEREGALDGRACRFDVVLVDALGRGERIVDAFGFEG